MLAWLLALALAESPVPLAGPPEVRRYVRPSYPAAMKVGVASVTCELDVTVDAAGLPARVAAREGCPSAFAVEAERSVALWAFAPASEGDVAVPAQFVVEVRFEADPCVVALTVQRDGRVSALATNRGGTCEVVPARVSVPAKVPSATCRARFDVTKTGLTVPEVEGCDGATAEWARKALGAFGYAPNEARFEVRLTLAEE